jgi:hypothetical protein
VAIHTEDSLRCAGVAQVLNLSLAIPTPKALSAKRLLAGQDSQILNLIPTRAAAICAIATDQ